VNKKLSKLEAPGEHRPLQRQQICVQTNSLLYYKMQHDEVSVYSYSNNKN